MSVSESTLDVVYAFLTRMGREPTESEIETWRYASEPERERLFEATRAVGPCVREGEYVVLPRDPTVPLDAGSRGVLLENDGLYVETGDSLDRPKRCLLFDKDDAFDLNMFDVRVVASGGAYRRVTHQAVNVERGWYEERFESGAAESPRECTARVVASQAHPMVAIHTLDLGASGSEELLEIHHVIRARGASMPRVVANNLGGNLVECVVDYPEERVSVMVLYELSAGLRHEDTRVLRDGEVRFVLVAGQPHEAARCGFFSIHTMGEGRSRRYELLRTVRKELFVQTLPDARVESLVDAHEVEWRDRLRVPSALRVTPKGSNDAKDVERMRFVETYLQVALFQCANRYHFIDEDDLYVTPILIALRPARARQLLDKRIERVNKSWPRRHGYEGTSTLGEHKRIYQSALLVFHMWLYHRATSDYGWLFQRVGTMHDLTTYVNEHRDTGAGFKNVDGLDGVRRDDDIFTDRVGALALQSTTNAAWRLTFDHYEIWEDFYSIPDHMVTTAERRDVDVPHDTLVVDTEMVDGSLVYVWWSRDEYGDQVPLGHAFGEDARTQMVLAPDTTYRVIRTQRVRQVYPIELVDTMGYVVYGLRDEDDVWEVASDRLGGYRFRSTNNLYQDVVNSFSSVFLGSNAFRESTVPPIPDTRNQLELGASAESLLTLFGIYAWRGGESASVLRNMADIEAGLTARVTTARESKLLVGGLRGSEARAYPLSAYRERKHAIDAAGALVLSTHGSAQPWGVDRPEETLFHFLFSIVGVYFSGEMTKDGVVYEHFGTEVRNPSILPSYMMSVRVDLPNVDKTVYNNLLDSSPVSAIPDDATVLLRYLSETRNYEVRPTLERLGISHRLAVFVRVDNGDFVSEVAVSPDDAARFVTVRTELRDEAQAVVKTQGGTSVALYDHDYALSDRTMNVYASTVFGVDELGNNFVELPVDILTVDQRDTVGVRDVEVRVAFHDPSIISVTSEWI